MRAMQHVHILFSACIANRARDRMFVGAFGRSKMQCNPNRIWYYREMKLKKGMRVRRSEIALKMLRSMGLDHEVKMGTVTGWSAGKHKGCVTVRVDGRRRGEPFKPELWEV